MKSQMFDIAVVDSNFYIALYEAGMHQILPEIKSILQNVSAKIASPSELPKTDIPRRFRDLRRTLPEHVILEDVNRQSALWRKLSHEAKQNHMIRYDKDPADIDIVVLAKNYSSKHRVAVVSDDAGIARVCNELDEFLDIDHLSNGAFLSILAAATTKKKQRQLLDDAVRAVFHYSWKYKRQTRAYIDIAALVEDLTDTARYVRTAMQIKRRKKKKKKAVVTPAPEVAAAPTAPPPDRSAFDALMPLFDDIRHARELSNIFEAEKRGEKVAIQITKILSPIVDIEQRYILTQYISSEMFQHHTWLLHQRLARDELFEALEHCQACLTYLNFINVDQEAIENLQSLKGLFYLLLGRVETAFNIFSTVDESVLTPVQRLGLVASLVYSGETQEAMRIAHADLPDTEKFLDSLFNLGVDASSRGKLKIAASIFEFILHCFEDQVDDLIDPAERLFLITRRHRDLLSSENTEERIKNTLGENAEDRTHVDVPLEWNLLCPFQINPQDPKTQRFLGKYEILEISKDDTNLSVLAWSHPLHSIWKLILPVDSEPAISIAITFKLTSGEITEIRPRNFLEPTTIRGVITVKSPAIQITAKRRWH